MENEKRKEEPVANASEPPVEQADVQAVEQNITDVDAEEQAEEAPLEDAAKLEQLERQIGELKDQYLRKVADFENFRKRMNREKQEAIEYANTALLLDIILVMDDFERALRAAPENAEDWTVKDFQTFCEGVSMIEKRLSSQLENKWGLKRFDSAGEMFDPNRHEALMMEKSSEVSEAKVAEDLVKGYTLKDRVIRPAKVKVTMPE
ncbi:MAG: nucleotide exchange factor GrpE [Treponema sp.]|jgi:molecular chaperone GrpE|nr:nucleotide exchange factor GrpE [Treponema sp.]